MKRHMSIKNVYLLTFISFIATFLFLYIFIETAEQFYSGWDNFTNTNTLSMFANGIFILLLIADLLGIILCIICTTKNVLNKVSRKNRSNT